MIGIAEDLEAVDERYDGGKYEIISAVAPADDPRDVIVNVDYNRAASRVVGADGDVLQEDPAAKSVNAQFRVVRDGDRWVVYGYRIFEGAS